MSVIGVGQILRFCLLPSPEARSTNCLSGKFWGHPAYAPSVVEGRLGTSCSSAPITHPPSQGRTASCAKVASIITESVLAICCYILTRNGSILLKIWGIIPLQAIIWHGRQGYIKIRSDLMEHGSNTRRK